MEKAIMTADEMAEVMRISRPKAYELIHSKDGPPVIFVGRAIRIPVSGFYEWLERQSAR